MKRRYWQKKEIDFIKENYKNKKVKELANLLNRNENSIQLKAQKINLNKYKKSRIWQKKERLFFVENYGKKMKIEEIASILNRTINDVKYKAYKLKLKSFLLKKYKWKDEEIKVLRENYGKKTVKVISQMLHKKERSIIDKANKLNLKSSLNLKELFKRKGKTYNEIYGKRKANRIKKLFSISRKGEKNSMFGKHHTNKAKAKIRKVISNARKNGSYNLSPNLPEKKLIRIIKRNNLPFNYVGDGKVIIKGFNPDFLSLNPKHIIEVFGDYWHNRENIKKRDENRIKAYSSMGYKTLILWEHELNDKEKIIEKIEEFIKR